MPPQPGRIGVEMIDGSPPRSSKDQSRGGVYQAGDMLMDLPHPDDPNGWLWQIRHHLRRTPAERLRQLATSSNWFLELNSPRWGLPYVEYSPRKVLQALTDSGACFVMVGMGAGYLQGAPYPTINTDFMPDPDPRNVQRLEHALHTLIASPLEAGPRIPVGRPVLPGLRQLFTSAGMVNVVDDLPGVGKYHTAKDRASLMDVGEGLSVWVADMEHVIRSKKTVGRRLDAVHVLMCRETLGMKTKG